MVAAPAVGYALDGAAMFSAYRPTLPMGRNVISNADGGFRNKATNCRQLKNIYKNQPKKNNDDDEDEIGRAHV